VSDAEVTQGNLKVELSNAVVRVLHDYVGRGPSKARAYVNDDMIAVVLRDTLTAAESSLADAGEAEFVQSLRRKLQTTMGPEMIAAVEELTGRSVMCFMSDSTLDPDVSAELFLLSPNGDAPDGA
jgi:uncharacterized protein YbcI